MSREPARSTVPAFAPSAPVRWRGIRLMTRGLPAPGFTLCLLCHLVRGIGRRLELMLSEALAQRRLQVARTSNR